MKKINRTIRYNSAETNAREEARPVGVKLRGSPVRLEALHSKKRLCSLSAIAQRDAQLWHGTSRMCQTLEGRKFRTAYRRVPMAMALLAKTNPGKR